ncbi:energy-coupling factor transporter transmembrane component T family protein [Mycolicibacterium fortuitum]|uniref:Cobalt ABC transporter n=2 Tax=Mycolicibacterium fortuitum TaxID=1766 RepID=K0UR86_MYCFO|nr:energy-coupling factor transporter transmembrane component T [Mycolicibacterium fortuitum]AIY45185.1 Transmembrane component YkoC of energizing module of thiamin-regulated ECF transporter for HydroxyMethylPyrimidine [Mycobacterium sp. VKM Ac-1817D]CRL80396.1 cobalt ABC transporter [Mycolicibacter nonchromogenicus]BDD97121.1 ABC transporter [Mycolicibacterium fortuitum subsp. fortuitum]EJZ09356.1 cobalt ABC transporter [Mycolicibacterium fortuitum subsp. fortuitum DSM 46621 = ATCC 6841 = JCM 
MTARTLNPVARLLTALIMACALVLSVDWVSALTALAGEVLLFAAIGVKPRAALKRGAVVTLAATLTAVTILLYGQVSGTVYWHFFLVTVSDGSIALAAATFLRVLAIALPSVILFIDVESTELADGLGQVLRLPARFVLGALASLRLVGLLGQDWQYLGYARRARGVADHARVRRLAGQTFALLVFAVRRGSKLATAMEARGFGAYPTRTWARPSPFGAREFALIAAGFVIAGVAITVSVTMGAWNFIGTR